MVPHAITTLLLLVSGLLPSAVSRPAHDGAESSNRGGDVVARRPNVLLIINDQHSPRALGCAGNTVVKTPRLDQLAKEGAYFRQAYCNDPICVPSRYSMMSGRYPTEIGAFSNRHVPYKRVRFLAEYLSDRGYFTGSSGKNHFVPENATHGFEDLYRHSFYMSHRWSHYRPWYLRQFSERGLEGDPFYWKLRRGWQEMVGPPDAGLCVINDRPADLSPEHWVTQMALRQIDRAQERDQPFFVHASYFAPHHPYGPLREYYDLYEGVEMSLPDSINLPVGYKRFFSDEDQRTIMRHYYGFVSQVDHYIGELLDGLDERGLARDTLVIMVSDHGDLMGEFGRVGKDLPHEASIGVPFFLRWPGRIPAKSVIDEPVTLLDVLPTVFDALGEEAPKVAQGESLLPLANGTVETLDRLVYSIDVRRDPYMFITVRNPRWKLVMWNPGRKFNNDDLHLYDILDDPGELNDLAESPEHEEIRDRLHASALEFWKSQEPFAKRPFHEPVEPDWKLGLLEERDR